MPTIGLLMILNIYNFSELPYSALKLICTESSSIYGPYPKANWDKGFIGLCSSCNKPRIHKLYICGLCEEYFIKDFKHPGFCWKDPICWDCLSVDSWCKHCEEYCPSVFSCNKEPPLTKRLVPVAENFNFKFEI